MPLTKFNLNPGVRKDDSPLSAEGYWIDADKVRFTSGKPETIGGWEYASDDTLLGIARGGMTWADNARNPYAAFGTHLRLYSMDVDGNTYDITPVISRSRISVAFTTVSGGFTVTAGYTAHGLVAYQKVHFDDTSTTAIGGVDLDADFTVIEAVDANSVTLAAAAVATSSAGPTAVTVDAIQYLAPGQVDGTGGSGYGTGGYGVGGYGSTSTVDYYPRTWSMAPWGQNGVFNPRGGKIYEWAPNLSASELVTNGTFTDGTTNWTLTGGFTYIGGSVLAAPPTTGAGHAKQNVTLPVGAWVSIKLDMTSYTYGTFYTTVGNTTVGAAINSNGRKFATFHSGAGGAKTFSISTGVTSFASFDNVSMDVLLTAEAITNAPTVVTCIFTTAERTLVACGCADTDGNFDALRVRWTDTQNNQTWTAAAANLAGSYTLTNGSRIVRGLPGNRENLIFTDTAAYLMRFVPDPNEVYSFAEIGSGCGLIGPNAAIQVAGRYFWYSNTGKFFVYDGSFPRPLVCTVERDLLDNLAAVQGDKIYALSVASKNEVWWIYPRSPDNECSNYVIYNYIEDHWSVGTFDRTTWLDKGIFQYPLAVDADGRIWFQEKGFAENGAARSWSIATARFDLGDGEGHMRFLGIQPDAEDLQGGYTVTVDMRIRNGTGIIDRTLGPFGITGATGWVDVRGTGQEAKLTFAGNSAPTFWRLGALRLDLEQGGRTR